MNLWPSLRSYISNSLWLIGEKLFAAAFGIIVVAFVARYLGPKDFGILSYAFSLAALFAVLGNLGLDGLVVRELVNIPARSKETLGTVLYLKLIVHSVAAGAMVIFAFYNQNHSETETIILSIAALIILLAPAQTVNSWFHSRVIARYIAYSSMATLLLAGIAKLASVWAGADIRTFAMINIFQSMLFLAALLYIYHLLKAPPLRAWRFSWSTARDLFSESWVIFLGTIFATIYLKIDQVMLRWLSGPEEVGVYSVAVRISEATYFIPAAIVASIFPKLIDIHKSSEAIFDSRCKNYLISWRS